MKSLDVQRLQHPTPELRTLTEVFKTLTLPLELPDLMNQVLIKIIGVLEPAQAGMVQLWDQSTGFLRPVASHGVDHMILKQMELRIGESITGRVFQDGKPRLYQTREEVAEALVDMRPANKDILIRALGANDLPLSAVSAPIFTGDQHFGVLILDNLYGPKTFQPEDLFLVQTLAELLAMAVDRTRLETRAEAIRAAREEEEMRYELMASLSHELRLPLTAIKGYSSALLIENMDWDVTKAKDFLHKIDQEVDNMQSMIKDLLDSSLIEVHQLKLEIEPIRLQYVAKDVAEEIQRRTEIHQITLELPQDLPMVNADLRWMKQVFRNLIDNAIKYSPEGGKVVIRGEVRPGLIVISISDPGIGIPPEELIPIFEKFTRVRSPRHFRIPGTGLGLPISRAIVEAHGGRIWVDSKVGQGTTAYFSLPVSQIPTPED